MSHDQEEVTNPGLRRSPYLEYVLLASDQGDSYSPFQGFGEGITPPAFAEILDSLAVLPWHPVEVFASAVPLYELRRGPARKVSSVVGPSLFLEMQAHRDWDDCIPVVMGLPKDIESVRAAGVHKNAILASTESTPNVISIRRNATHPAQILDAAIKERLISILPKEAGDILQNRPLRAAFASGTEPSRAAGVTAPNEALCESLGYAYFGRNPIVGTDDPKPYVEAIIESAEQSLRLSARSRADVVLYIPSIVRHLHSFNGTFWNRIFRKVESKRLRAILKDGLFRNKNYSGFTISLDSVDDLPDISTDPVASYVMGTRQRELRLMSSSIGAIAASGMQPAIRLPNSINFHDSFFKDIERHSKREDPRGRRLLQDSYRRLEASMASQTNPLISEFISTKADSVTVVADAPIEWIRIDGLPLMIRHDVSRIGMTPGNLMLQQCVYSGLSSIHWESLDEVLVIRSFSDTDHIRFTLERAVTQFKLTRLNVKFVDVHDRAELVSALNGFKGNIAIFDCHGDHGGGDNHAWLSIGRERVDPWSLAGVARVPPIVVLSACSTFAIAGSHASAANGLIRSGAVTVLGTFLPVNATLSGLFVARLLYRIDSFLPALKASNVVLTTWRSLVSSLLRMSYASDLLHFFIGEKQWIRMANYHALSLAANVDINEHHPDWYDRHINRLGRAAGRSAVEIQNTIDHDSPLMETMYYCQVGRPECLGIVFD